MYAMHGLTTFEAIAIWAVFGIAILGLLYAVFLRGQIMREDKGSAKMQEVWGAIRDGADAYLRQQLKSILPSSDLTIALFFSVYIVPPTPEAMGASQAWIKARCA
jgi:K(+)-stimulated pyrophosphate-energized sodium pump